MLREAQAMAKLVHPNVITVHEAAELGDIVFIAMELVNGETLGEWGRSHPPGTRARFDRLLDFAIQAASGLVAAHDAGLVHRDLKPANLLGRGGTIDLGRGAGREPSACRGRDDDPHPGVRGAGRPRTCAGPD
jgi:eukaryotic-like serine/threonine-protein kinase